jgi:hypothetical protein
MCIYTICVILDRDIFNMYISKYSLSPTCLPANFAYWLSVSNAVRFDDHGIRFYSPSTTELVSNIESYTCSKNLNGLCTSGKIRFFECGDSMKSKLWSADLVKDSALTSTSQLETLWTQTMSSSSSCNGKMQYLLGNMYHDVSLCDLSTGVSILFKDYVIQVLYDPYVTNPYIYWTYIILMFFLTLYLSESVATMFGDIRTLSYSVISGTLCTLTVIVVICTTNFDFFITTIDKTTYVFSIIYIILYALYHVYHRIAFNMIVGTLCLVFSRICYTFEHMYCIPAIFLLTARLIQKSMCILNPKKNDSMQLKPDTGFVQVLSWGFILLDIALIFLLYFAGMSDAYADSIEAVLYIFCIVFVAWITARLLFSYESALHSK